MSISDIKARRIYRRYTKTIRIGWYLAAFLILFGGIYEYFSFEVYSAYMVYAFAFPLFGITAVFSLLRSSRRTYPGTLPKTVYMAGLATLTFGSLITGILEIYGTTNRLTRWYWIVGIPLTAVGLAMILLDGHERNREISENEEYADDRNYPGSREYAHIPQYKTSDFDQFD